jgi:hypothetical protein
VADVLNVIAGSEQTTQHGTGEPDVYIRNIEQQFIAT